MHRRGFLTGMIGVAVPLCAPAVLRAEGLFVRAAAPLIDIQRGGGPFDRLDDPEPEPGAMPVMAPVAPQMLPDLTGGAPVLAMWNANTDEHIAVRPVNGAGLDMAELDRVNHFMRDWRRNEIKPLDPPVVLALLGVQQAARRMGFTGEVRFLSGYRSRATNDALRAAGHAAARNSLHIEAKAIDFSLPGIGIPDSILLAKNVAPGGVGGYPSFVHIDSGRRRFWGTAV